METLNPVASFKVQYRSRTQLREIETKAAEWSIKISEDIYVNPARRMIRSQNQAVLLSKGEYSILEKMLLEPGEPRTAVQIVAALGGQITKIAVEDLINRLNLKTRELLGADLVRKSEGIPRLYSLDPTALRPDDRESLEIKYTEKGEVISKMTSLNEWSLHLFEDIYLSPSRQMLRRGNEAVVLAQTEYALLQSLLEKPRFTTTTESLCRALNGVDPGALRNIVYRLNQKALPLLGRNLVSQVGNQSMKYQLVVREPGPSSNSEKLIVHYQHGERTMSLETEALEWSIPIMEEIYLNPQRRMIRKGDQVIRLGENEYSVLESVLTNAGSVVKDGILLRELGPTSTVESLKTTVERINGKVRIFFGQSPLARRAGGYFFTRAPSVDAEIEKYQVFLSVGGTLRAEETEAGEWSLEIDEEVYLNPQRKMLRKGTQAVKLSNREYIILEKLLASENQWADSESLSTALKESGYESPARTVIFLLNKKAYSILGESLVTSQYRSETGYRLKTGRFSAEPALITVSYSFDNRLIQLETAEEEWSLFLVDDVYINPTRKMLRKGTRAARLSENEYALVEEILFSPGSSVSVSDLVANSREGYVVETLRNEVSGINAKLGTILGERFIELARGYPNKYYIAFDELQDSVDYGILRYYPDTYQVQIYSKKKGQYLGVAAPSLIGTSLRYLLERPGKVSTLRQMFDFFVANRLFDLDRPFDVFKSTYGDQLREFNATFKAAAETETPLISTRIFDDEASTIGIRLHPKDD